MRVGRKVNIRIVRKMELDVDDEMESWDIEICGNSEGREKILENKEVNKGWRKCVAGKIVPVSKMAIRGL